jgi:predicted AAA+ superfamily ATPase
MVKRSRLQARITRALKRSRIVGLIGPRQSGKTTLAQNIVPANSTNYFDLEDPVAYELEPRVRVLPIRVLASASVDALFPRKHRKRAGPEVE